MRRLNVDALAFKEFFDSEIPPYVILSHRWGEDEVSYKRFSKRHKLTYAHGLKNSPGYRKILNFATPARELYKKTVVWWQPQDIAWGWTDTCCIDKSSSAELSEAINSMSRWYQRSALCIVHLADVRDATSEAASGYAQFVQSEWFHRGWTLQELLFPKNMLFVDAKWHILGDKSTLSGCIAEVTRIPSFVLTSSTYLFQQSVATRMSWAAHRVTSRVETIAYCLFGLFEINLPLLYGEGDKAFKRLQSEILRTTGDETIFVWQPVSRKSSFHNKGHGLLASQPNEFRRSAYVVNDPYWQKLFGLDESVPPLQLREIYHAKRAPHIITNLGLQISTRWVSHPTLPKARCVFLHAYDSCDSCPFVLEIVKDKDLDDESCWLVSFCDREDIREDLFTKLLAGKLEVKHETIFMRL